MLVSQAHSFAQQAKLAVTLAWIAGYTNVLTLLACGTVTAHVSGTTSTFGREAFTGNWSLAAFALFIITTFFLGAALSGICIETGRRRAWESIFVLPMVIEVTLLATFALLLQHGAETSGAATPLNCLMIGLASAAMGLQNATITQISSGQVRTTHMTGVLTDLGQELSIFLWRRLDRRAGINHHIPHGGHAPSGRRLVLLACLFAIFAGGAGLGTLAFLWQPDYAMFPPVFFLLWIIYQDVSTPIAEISEVQSHLVGADLPQSLAVYHLRKDSDRRGRIHRTPNLLAWSERLPAHNKVVILDLADISEFNANAILEFKNLLDRFKADGRVLILSGLTVDQLQTMAHVAEHPLPLESVCPDLELAIARGVNCLSELDLQI